MKRKLLLVGLLALIVGCGPGTGGPSPAGASRVAPGSSSRGVVARTKLQKLAVARIVQNAAEPDSVEVMAFGDEGWEEGEGRISVRWRAMGPFGARVVNTAVFVFGDDGSLTGSLGGVFEPAQGRNPPF